MPKLLSKSVYGVVFALALGAGTARAQSASPSPAASINPAEACKPGEPEKEHAWLKQLEGDWDLELEARMAPDQPPMKSKGKESVQMLGAFWAITSLENQMAPGQTMRGRLTLGFDAKKKKYTGTWVSDMEGRLWTYEGSLDATGKVLTLDTEGPNMTDPAGKDAKYQDKYELHDADHRTFSSSIQGADGKWFTFMTSKATRAKK